MIAMLNTKRFPLLLSMSVILTAIPAGTEEDVGEAGCLFLSNSVEGFARRLQLFELRVASNRMISASLRPSACDPKLVANELKAMEISEGASKPQEMVAQLAKMDTELNLLRGKYAELQDRVGQLDGYVGAVVAKKHAPATCQELRELGLAKSGWYPIDPDGVDVGEDPINVFCDMIPADAKYPSRGVTRIGHNHENQTVEVRSCHEQGCHKTTVIYNGSMNQIRHLINISDECTQEIQYNCLSAPLTLTAYESKRHAGSWRGPDGARNVYWDGSHEPEDHVCACHSAGNNCSDAGQRCNCDSLLPPTTWKTDAGVLTNKTALPVVELTFQGLSRAKNEQAANFTLGSLVCSSKARQPPGADPEPDIREKRKRVKQMFRHAWVNYIKYVWGSDCLRPELKGCWPDGKMDTNKELALPVIVEALDTLFLMDMGTEFDRGLYLLEKAMRPNEFGRQFGSFLFHFGYEDGARSLGGLLSSFALSGDARLLRMAVLVADAMLRYLQFDNELDALRTMEVGDNGSPLLELTVLSQLTGESEYSNALQKARMWLRSHFIREGPRLNKDPHPKEAAVNKDDVKRPWPRWRSTRRFHDSLLKSWLASGRQDQDAWDTLWLAMDAMTNRILQRSESGMSYIPSMITFPQHGGDPDYGQSMNHKACFWGGLYALYARELQQRLQQKGALPPATLSPLSAPSDETQKGTPHAMANIGRALTATCHQAYNKTKTKLGPWLFEFRRGANRDAEVDDAVGFELKRAHDLWHQAVESYFVLWRLTGDKKYQEWGWEAVQAIEKHCRTDFGFSGITDVNQVPAELSSQHEPNVFVGTTLKYLYLLFSDGDLLPLDRWVFNAMGHPLPIRAPGGA